MQSGIHGWGLLARREMKQDSMIIEYRGEALRRGMADLREKVSSGKCWVERAYCHNSHQMLHLRGDSPLHAYPLQASLFQWEIGVQSFSSSIFPDPEMI